MIIAGEASGDLHAARLLTELQKLAPGLQVFGLGGREMRATGAELIAESAEISVVGISEVIRILPRARKIFRDLLAEVDRRQTRMALLIDFPDFNLRLAKALRQRGVSVFYYISPQVWAWRRGRVKTISRLIQRMLVILPFEVDFYRQHGVDAVHVGHPLIDEVPELEQRWDSHGEAEEPFSIALLPGSRDSEIRANLPAMLAAAKELQGRISCEFRLIKAATVSDESLASEIAASELEIDIVRGDRFQAIADSHLAVCASGTATLEVGLLGTPMVVVYRVSPWTYLLGRLLVSLPHIALVNLVLNRRTVPELLQRNASPERIADTAAAILSDRDRIRTMRSELLELRQRLGDSGASRRAALRVWLELQSLEATP